MGFAKTGKRTKKIRNVCLASMPDHAGTGLDGGVTALNIAKGIAITELMLIGKVTRQSRTQRPGISMPDQAGTCCTLE